MFSLMQTFVAPFVISFGGSFWHDSVRGDRVTIVKIGDEIRAVTFEELFNMFSDKVVKVGDRELIYLDNIEVYALTPKRAEDNGATGGWARIRYIERHKVGKKLYRVATKFGETVVTEDHSLVTLKDGRFIEIKPMEVSTNNLPVRIHTIEGIDEVDTIDMWKCIGGDTKYVKFKCNNCSHIGVWKASSKVIRCPKCRSRKVSIVEELSGTNDGFYLDSDVIRFTRSRFKMGRYLTGNELRALMRLIGAYVSEGCLADHKDESDRIIIMNNDVDWLKEIGETVKGAFNTSYSISYHNGSRVYRLEIISTPLKRIIEKLCGRRAPNKKLPDFALRLKVKYLQVLLKDLIKGDGYREQRTNRPTSEEYIKKYFRYTTISRKLASQMCFILSRLGIKYSVWYDLRRSDPKRKKVAYTIAVVTKYWRSGDAKVTIEDVTDGNEYVYDLEVEDTHIFVDGIGLIGLHNTMELVIPPTEIPIDVSYVPDENFKTLIIGLTFGGVREFDPATGTIGPEILSTDVGIYHKQEGYMDWHWDPFVESIIKTNPYPQLLWSSRERPYELRVINKTGKYIWGEATFWAVKFPKKIPCPLHGECDPEELFKRYMRGVASMLIATEKVGPVKLADVLENLHLLLRITPMGGK